MNASLLALCAFDTQIQIIIGGKKEERIQCTKYNDDDGKTDREKDDGKKERIRQE